MGPINCKACDEMVEGLNYLTAMKVNHKRSEIVDSIIGRGEALLPRWPRFAIKQAPRPVRRIVDRWIDRAIRRGAAPVRSWRHNWASVVTTAPRRGTTLERCIKSMRIAGWDPIVFAEPGSFSVDAETIEHPKRLEVWRNWLTSVKWALKNTDADVILTVQDDSVFHPDSRELAERLLWPDSNCAFLSLYIAKHYQLKHDNPDVWSTGVRRVRTRSFGGACALTWPRPVLEQALQTKSCP